jgi:hypothetical protein
MSRLKNQQPWAVEVLVKMLELKLAKRDVAKQLKMNYVQFCNIINGNVIQSMYKERIINHVNKLYEKKRDN